MMAFFLLLWLLSVTNNDQRKGIADYFAPVAVAHQTSGSGGVLGGQTIAVPGALVSASGQEPATPPAQRARADRTPPDAVLPDAVPLDATLDDALAKREQQQFDQAADSLRKAIAGIPDLAQLADSLVIDQTPEGLRIQIVDQANYSMFPLGSAQMYAQTRALLGLVAQVVARLPNRLSISGHTDSTPYARGDLYGNWELSTDRANASRRALTAAGIDEARIATVVGRADREHLTPEQPESPRNRRISIVLLRTAVPRNAPVPVPVPVPVGGGR
jgi:chemotaxis protein MotB